MPVERGPASVATRSGGILVGWEAMAERRTPVSGGKRELDLADDRHAVVGDGGSAEFLLQNHVATLGAKADSDRAGDDVDAPF